MEPLERVQWVYSSKSNDELIERYKEWAFEYDSDLEAIGYTGPSFGAETLAKYVPKHATILDAGAGTGLVGVQLADRGYGDLTAMDMSEAMLAQAAMKNVYRDYRQMTLGTRLGFEDDSFDAAISIGVMTEGHAPASSLDELVRIVRASGHVVFSLRPDVHKKNGFKEKQEELVSAGKWRLVEVTDEAPALSKGESGILHQIWAYRVTA